MYYYADHPLDECSSCQQEFAAIWKVLVGRQKRTELLNHHQVEDFRFEKWKLFSCDKCNNYLLLRDDLKKITFNIRFEITYRFISKNDFEILKHWVEHSHPLSQEHKGCLDEIGYTPTLWFEESVSAPCRVQLKNGTSVDCVEHVFPKGPPLPNRLRPNAEEFSFWDRYAGLIFSEEVADVEISPFAFSYHVRAEYEDNYFPMIERVSAAHLSIADAQGRRATLPAPPPNWCHDPRIEPNSSYCLKTRESVYHTRLEEFSGDIFALISSPH